jgi:hypothetical protein
MTDLGFGCSGEVQLVDGDDAVLPLGERAGEVVQGHASPDPFWRLDPLPEQRR